MGQSDLIKKHNHIVPSTWAGEDGDYNLRRSAYQNSGKTETSTVGGIENRPLNITLKLWKRTA